MKPRIRFFIQTGLMLIIGGTMMISTPTQAESDVESADSTVSRTSDRACKTCHTSQETLMSLAVVEPQTEALSSGPG